jgi:deoxyribodipyrimidine photo-lyase
MTTPRIPPDRIQHINDHPINPDGRFVLYWMQQSQRHCDNHALEHAVHEANFLEKPLLVGFGLKADYPDANARHYAFMLDGLTETFCELRKRGIEVCLRLGNPPDVAAALAKDAALTVCDRGYLRHQREWRRQFAKSANCRVVQVESDAVVPVETASNKVEYAARTIRPKLMGQYEHFLTAPNPENLENPAGSALAPGEDLANLAGLMGKLKLDTSVAPVSLFPSGPNAAKQIFQDFLQNKLENYAENRNQPQTNDVSHMSKYLHFGQVSPSWLICEVGKFRNDFPEAVDSFIEELLVRRELALNFTHFSDDYDRYDTLPEWALATLSEHRDDNRPHLYTPEQFENAQTHDEYWNAAMNEMRFTGYMHNYMRMYWGKKILEWSKTPEQAFETALRMNNRYFIDGRDPNSYTGVAWIFGRHDRPWQEREIYGKIRCMMASGLERKCDIQRYVEKVSSFPRAQR